MADGTLKVGTITTSSGSGTITLGQSGETINIPSGKAGLYCFFIAYQYNGDATQNHTIIQRKDSSGNLYQNGGTNIDGGYNLIQDIRGISFTMYYNCVAGDRIEARTQQFSGSTQTLYYPRTFFGAYKIIGA